MIGLAGYRSREIADRGCPRPCVAQRASLLQQRRLLRSWTKRTLFTLRLFLFWLKFIRMYMKRRMANLRRTLRAPLFPIFVAIGLILMQAALRPDRLNAQSQGEQATGIAPYTSVVVGTVPTSPARAAAQASAGGPGLTIIPTFDPSVDAATQAVIHNVIVHYENLLASHVTVNIYFFNMNSGLGESVFYLFIAPYNANSLSYRPELVSNATSADDSTALASDIPNTYNNPVTSDSNMFIKGPVSRALDASSAPEQQFPSNSPCPNFTGSGCIGINVSEANSLGVLRATIEHEIDEILGLGSSLQDGQTPSEPSPEDFFRWASDGVRSFARNSCTPSTPAAYFSLDAGGLRPDQFNNCDNGADYGDWVTHTPSQVQDAITNATGDPFLLFTSPEVRALDAMGFNIAFNHFAEVAVWRPSNGIWYLIPQTHQGATIAQQWGTAGDVPLRGDFDGDGKNDIAVWRPSTGQWFIIPSSNAGTSIVQSWGTPGDIPVPGDYDGDGTTDLAVFRPSNGTWYIIPSSTGSPIVQQWGTVGDIPVPGDYDGDRKTDIAVFRPSNGTWYIIPSGNSGTPLIQPWGTNGDSPVPGDYDGDGITDLAVWRPSNGTWYIIPSGNPGTPLIQPWGTNGDSPVPGDYDGDGITDVAVWRPSTGTWYVIQSSSSTVTITQWGTTDDVPIQKPIGQ
jgi:hypothetical protein